MVLILLCLLATMMVNLPLECDLETPTHRDWGDAFWSEELRHKEREVHLRVHANTRIAILE